jgi:hypothetical protein
MCYVLLTHQVLQQKPLAAYKDSSNNLGLNSYFFSEPAVPEKAKVANRPHATVSIAGIYLLTASHSSEPTVPDTIMFMHLYVCEQVLYCNTS